MKFIPKESLVIRESFNLPYAGGAIWCVELDSLSVHTDIVQNKFLKDIETIRKPSLPAFISINLTDTLVDSYTTELIINGLLSIKRPLKKIAFIGLNGFDKRMFESLLKKHDCTFAYKFIIDAEKAKEWLILNK